MNLVQRAATRLNRAARKAYYTIQPRVGSSYYALKMNRLLRHRKDESLPPNRLFGQISDDFWYWMMLRGYHQSPELQQILPGYPDSKVQLTIAATAGEITLRQGFFAYQMFRRLYEKHRDPLGDAEQILDFGCGWGRIIRFFLKDLAPEKLWGIDCWDSMIDICKKTNRWCRFLKVERWPPTSLPAEWFDMIYSFSVFSHLSEEMHLRWLDEFRRVLKPGGLVIATTRPRGFLAQCAQLRGQANLADHLKHLPALFSDTAAYLRAYDEGQYCYNPAQHDAWWGETCIPEGYVRREWAKRLEVVEFIDDPTVCDQCVIVARKPVR